MKMIIALILIVLIIVLSYRPKPRQVPVPVAPKETFEERQKRDEKAYLARMRKQYPIHTSPDGERYIRTSGKRHSITYNIRKGQTDFEAYHAFQQVANVIIGEENIYGEF